MTRFLTFALVGLALLVGACSPSVIVTHARAARVVAPLLHTAHDVIHDGRARALDICEGLPDVAAREPCLDARIAEWEPAVTTYNLVREGYVAWTDGMALMLLSQAEDAEASAYLLPLALALVRLYNGVKLALEPFELDLPTLPDLSILGGP